MVCNDSVLQDGLTRISRDLRGREDVEYHEVARRVEPVLAEAYPELDSMNRVQLASAVGLYLVREFDQLKVEIRRMADDDVAQIADSLHGQKVGYIFIAEYMLRIGRVLSWEITNRGVLAVEPKLPRR